MRATKTRPRSSLMGHTKAVQTLRLHLFKVQTFNTANIQTSVASRYERRTSQSDNKELELRLHLPELFKPSSLIAQSRARRQTPSEEDLEEQNTGPCAQQRLQSLPPHPVSSLKRRLHLWALVLGREACQRHGSQCLQRRRLIQSQHPHCFYFLFHGIKMKWNILNKLIYSWGRKKIIVLLF